MYRSPQRPPSPPGPSRRRLLAAAVATLAAGCGYSVRPPYDARLQTVYVPVFKSISFSRDVNLQLTELVQKEIEKRTPYKVVGSPDGADTVLEGTIIQVDKNLGVENPYNLPRQIYGLITVAVTWTDNRSGRSASMQTAPVRVLEMKPFFPELGETASLGYNAILQKIAQDIVGMMEEPW
jgi:hypothetical protein